MNDISKVLQHLQFSYFCQIRSFSFNDVNKGLKFCIPKLVTSDKPIQLKWRRHQNISRQHLMTTVVVRPIIRNFRYVLISFFKT